MEVEVVGRAEGQQLVWGSGARAEEGKKYEAGRGVPSLNSHAPNEEQADGPGVSGTWQNAPAAACSCPTDGTGPHRFSTPPPRAAQQVPAKPPPVAALPEPLTKWSHDGSRTGTGRPRKLVRRRNDRRFAGGIFEHVSRSLRWHNWASFLVRVFESSAQQQRSTAARPEPKPTGQTVQPLSPAGKHPLCGTDNSGHAVSRPPISPPLKRVCSVWRFECVQSGEVHRPKTWTVIKLRRSASVGLDKHKRSFSRPRFSPVEQRRQRRFALWKLPNFWAQPSQRAGFSQSGCAAVRMRHTAPPKIASACIEIAAVSVCQGQQLPMPHPIYACADGPG